MRAHRGLVVGWLVVGAFAVALVVVTLTTPQAHLRPGDRADDGSAAEAFTQAWERWRTGTFVRSGTYERRSETTDAVISSEDVLAQRPPQRLHRQLGGVDGRDDDRLIVCPAPPSGGADAQCRLGERGGPTYDESVASEIDGLRSMLVAPAPLYAVAQDAPGCFELAQQRADPRAPFGIEARFCFDETTGAVSTSLVRYEGGIVEVMASTEIHAEVTDDDVSL